MRTFTLTHTAQHPELDYNAYCQCSIEANGNFHDFIPREPGRLVVSIGDLPSPGTGPALTVPCLQALVRGLTSGCRDDLAGLARDLNGALNLFGPRDTFAPWFYALIDPVRHELRYVNAGHEPPILVRRNGVVHRLRRTGPPLGLAARGTHRQETAAIDPGDLLLMFSEGMAASLSEGAILDVVFQNFHAGSAELTRRVFEEVDRSTGPQWVNGDRTFGAVRVTGSGRQFLPEDAFIACAA